MSLLYSWEGNFVVFILNYTLGKSMGRLIIKSVEYSWEYIEGKVNGYSLPEVMSPVHAFCGKVNWLS